MITIALTYRNRDMEIVSRCLDSLNFQSQKDFKVFIVDYGSNLKYRKELSKIAIKYDFVKVISCDTSNQLWCKSRAINIVLKQCDTQYFFVGDIDMMYHPNFIEKLKALKSETTVYFQVGFLNEEESKLNKEFQEYNIDFTSTSGATGMTFFNTETLKEIYGYEEFYHGWGSEDTDVHARLENAGHKVRYFDDEVLMLHQWHKKEYRTMESLSPFHSYLEQINEEYLNFTKKGDKVRANQNFEWGFYDGKDYESLKKVEHTFRLNNSTARVQAILNSVLLEIKDSVICIEITSDQRHKSLKQKTKKALGKKITRFLDMEDVNDLLIETIIYNLRTSAYSYEFNQKKQSIKLVIKL